MHFGLKKTQRGELANALIFIEQNLISFEAKSFRAKYSCVNT